MELNEGQKKNYYDIGEQFFKLRDYTPIPIILLLFLVQHPSVLSATLGTLVVIAGELIRLYSVAFIGSISRTRKASLGSALVSKGPFGIVRNPLYVGNFLIVVGMTVFSGVSWLVLLAIILFAVQYFFIVQWEEKGLAEKFGEEYEEYKRRVPAWLPFRMPRLDELEWPDSFSMAFKSEQRTLTAIAAMLLLMSLRS